MLLELRVKNFALIESLQVSFGDTFNVLTGETGAGKTILLQALGLLCGAKFLAGSARDENMDVVVEALFTPKNDSNLKEILDELGLEYEHDEWVLRRIIHSNGRNKCSLNGNLLRVQDLKKLAPFLVDVHSQHQTGQLLDPKNHLDFLLSYCPESVRGQLMVYRSKVKAYRDLCLRQENSDQYGQKLTREIAQLEVELQEIEDIRPEVGEEKILTETHLRLVNSGEIQSLLHDCRSFLDPSKEQSAISELFTMEQKLESLLKLDRRFSSSHEDLQAVNVQMEELRQTLAIFESEIESVSTQEIFEVEERLGNLEKLKRKYGATIAEVLEYESHAAEKLFNLQKEYQELGNLDSEVTELGSQLIVLADELNQKLESFGIDLAKQIQKELFELQMKDATFLIRFEDALGGQSVKLSHNNDLRSLGMRSPRDCQFFMSANKGMDPLPLAKVASGGEISRVMLALKLVFSAVHPAQTFVFDEIDAGIGGETAHAVADVLKKISLQNDQNILVITHLPQVAVKASRHFKVQKKTQGDITITTVELLEDIAVREEISRMMGLKGSSIELREIIGETH